MAIYHLSVGFVSRSTGRSSVQNAAYITGEKLHESRRDLDINYQNRHSDIAYSATLIPEHADRSFTSIDLWDRLESFEDAYAAKRFPNGEVARCKYMNSCQTAMTIVAALPKELSLESSKELLNEYIKERFISRGLIVTYAIHNDAGNPHAHFLISRRSIDEKGEISWLKDREICTKKELMITRSLWADKVNIYLERDGFDARITEKSFLDLAVDLHPTKHHGWYADKLIGEGKESRIIVENEKVFIDNKQKIEITPTVILDEITSKQATFSQSHLLKNIQKRIGDDVNILSYVFQTCLEKAIPVGHHIDGNIRYTSSSYDKIEKDAISLLNDFKDQSFKQNVEIGDIEKTISESYSYLSDEQKKSVFGLLKNDALSVMIGRAGSGKTTTLRAVSECYTNAGYRVLGTSLSALSAENLGQEAGIPSSTLHSILYKLNAYQAAQEKFLSFNSVMEEGLFKQLDWYKDLKRYETATLNNKTVIIVDEAGMVGTNQWKTLLHFAKHAGSKIIAVGDDHQFKAIDAGDFFREIKNTSVSDQNLFELSTIRRQKEDWMRDASHHFANLQVQEGVSAYDNRGFVHASDKNNIATDIGKMYLEKINAYKNVAVLAYTNAQAQEINLEIRDLLKAYKKIGSDTILDVGDKTFSHRDKIIFLKNDKKNVMITDHNGEKIEGDFIKNGSTGTLLSASKEGDVIIQLDETRRAHFNIKNYQAINYGYALTAHKSQGQTVDVCLIAASKNMDTKALYVAMTRHKEEAHLFYKVEDFKTINHMKIAFSKYEDKDLVKDYTIRPEHEAAYHRVQNYKLCALDAAAVLKDQESFDFKAYHEIKKEQITLGKEILKDFNNHRHYINQSGLTEEMLAITVGEKQRPLSIIEEQAKLRVELYGEMSKGTRTLWKDIKGKDQSAFKEKVEEFQTMKHERNTLAKDILENYRLHAPFVKDAQKEYGISKKTMVAQTRSSNLNERILEGKKIKDYPLAYDRTFSDQKRFTYQKTSHEIVDELNSNIKDIATHFLGKPTSQTSREWRYGKKGSLSLQVSGQKQGLYANFQTGESGNVVHFIAEQLGVDKKEAFKWGVEYLGVGQKPLQREPVQKDKTPHSKHPAPNSENWIPTYPITVPYPDLKSEKQLSYMLKGRHEVAKFEYKDAEGKTLGYVVRLEDKDGNKVTPTLTYCQNDKGQKQWMFKGFGDDRPLYGLDILKQKESAPVLIVEGEKTCEAARLIFKDHAVITWSGGCGAVQKSDWSVLKDRDVTIWPDHDKPGYQAANKIAAILNAKDVKSVALIDLPSTLPHKWDLADKLPDGFTHEGLMKEKSVILNINSSLKTYTEEEQKERDTHIIDYLTKEIDLAKKDWLSDEASKKIIKDIPVDPNGVLKEWQNIVEDYNFKPLTHKQFDFKNKQLTKLYDHSSFSVSKMEDIEKINSANIDKMLQYACDHLSINKQILDIEANFHENKNDPIILKDFNERKEHAFLYVRESVKTDQFLSDNEKISLLKKNEKDPIETLKEWQYITNDNSFTPLNQFEQNQKIEYLTHLIKENTISHHVIENINSVHIEKQIDVIKEQIDKLYNTKDTSDYDKKRSHDIDFIKNLTQKFKENKNNPERQKAISSKIENIAKNYQNDDVFKHAFNNNDQLKNQQKDLQNTMNKQLER